VAAVVSTAVLSAGLVAVVAPHASAAVDIAVLPNSSSYLDGAERHIVGEVQNNGSASVEVVQLRIAFLDAGGTEVGSDTAIVSVDRLAPGEKGPFHEVFVPPAGYDHYAVTYDSANEIASPPNHNFTILSSSDQILSGFRHVTGSIRNDNTTDADFVQVVITFYNGATVVDEASDYVDDDATLAGQASHFDVQASSVPAYTRYTLLGQSNSTPSPGASPSPTATASPTASPNPTATPTASPTGSPSTEVAPVISVAPSTISAGQRVTVTYTGRPGSTLQIWSKTQPATAYSQIGSVVLDANGVGTSSHAPTKNTRISAKTAGGLESGQPLISVRSVASINARRIAARSYSFTGRVYPARNGRLVSLYRNGVLLAQGRTDSTGIYTISKVMAAGTYSFFVRTGDDTYNLGTSSPTRRVAIS
jgi:hypothetical protein